jgi:hypothetical protein
MNTFRKISGSIFAILFIATALPALFLFSFDRSGFSAETYQKAFARDDFYAKVPSVMAEAMISTTTDQNKFPIMLQGMSQDAWEAFFRTMLPAETLKLMGDDILNSTFAYLNRKTDSAQFSLTPLKENLASDSGVQAVFTLLKTQPDCTLLQIGQMTLNLLNKSEVQFCNPPQEMTPLLTPVIKAQLQAVTLTIPDQFTLISAPPKNDPRVRLQIARFVMRLSPILPLAFLLLMTILVVNSLKSWLSWWGFPLVITGGLASLMSLIGAPIFGTLFEQFLVSRMPLYLPTILLAFASDLAAAMLKALLRPVLWEGLCIGFVGVVMVFISFFVGNKK